MQPRIAPCTACAQPMSLDAKACPKCGHPNPIGKRSPALTVFIAAIVLGGLYYAGSIAVTLLGLSSPRTTPIYVECRSAGARIEDGLACTIDNTAGTSNRSVCWDFNIVCGDGTKATAHGCGSAEASAKSSTMMPYAAFGGALERCKSIATSSVTNVNAP